jgi:hypothetical protein
MGVGSVEDVGQTELNSAAASASKTIGGGGIVGILKLLSKGSDGAPASVDASNPAYQIKTGSSGGPTAGMVFPRAIKAQQLLENPDTCVFCMMKTDSPQIDHATARVLGGNATIENAQTTCPFCNASKGARLFPVNRRPATLASGRPHGGQTSR